MSMARKIALLLMLLVPCVRVYADPPPFCYSEIDGSPTGCYKKLKVSNGALTDNGDGTMTLTTGVGGGGDVSGPGSATDNAVTRFDGTGGKTIQNSVVTISDTGNMAGVGTLNTHTIPGGTGTLALTSGNVATATALATNGLNCSTGSFPLGVDASGAVESCTDVWTEAENTSAAYLNATAANLLYQPLEATLTDIADGTITEDLVNTANPWADNEVADNITASNYLPLAGGVLTGEATADDLGLEFTAGDALTDCSTFSATGGGIFYDDSEGKFKKCQDNTLSDLDTTGAGATITVEEDNVTVDGSATNLDFLGADFDVSSSPAGEANVLIASGLTRDTEWDTESEVQTAWGSVNILLETEIDASSELRALMDDESGTGALLFADGAIGAATATTPSADDNDTSVATTAYVQTEINASGGRSITCASGSCDADAELYTDTKCLRFENPVAADDLKSIWYAKNATTITSLWCESDQTVTAMLQVDDGSPADVDSVDLTCDSTPPEDTSLDGDATMAAGDRLDLDIASVSGTPTWVTICWTATKDE